MSPQRSPIVVITGASAGVGRATTRLFARRGYDVGLIARGEDGLRAAAEEVRAEGRRAEIFSADVADAEAVEAAAEHFETRLGAVDVWVNDAMVTVYSRVSDMTASEYRRVTEVTYLGAVHGTMAALKRMLPRDRGTIVQVGSALAYRGIPLQSAYCAAKHAILGFTESLRSELLHDQSDVHVSIVQLPALNTPQFQWAKSRMQRRPQPIPPIFQPEIAADAILYAAEHRRRELLVGFPTLKTVWANRMAPWLLDEYLAQNGFDGQQTDELEDARRPSNLWTPVAGDHGAHGRFDTRSNETSIQLWANKNRDVLALLAGGIAVGAIAAAAGWTKRPHSHA